MARRFQEWSIEIKDLGVANDLAIDVAAIACRRGLRLVLKDLSFSLPAGEMLVVTGPNGAGKSTLLRALAGLVAIEAGVIRIDPLPHYISHADAVKPALTVAENLGFTAGLLNAGGTAIRPALAALGLDRLADLPGRHLSAGQRRRLALARLMAVPRRIWLLDEPLTGLDREGAARLGALIADHRAGGGTVVAATHQAFDSSDIRSLELGIA